MIGQTVSHYRILEKLGEGGMGVVYKAEDTRLGRCVALKFLPPERTRDERAKTRFAREARAASVLQHNNICTVHEIDESPDGHMFICMDFYDGATLREKIRNGPLAVQEALGILVQLVEGLAKAHNAGVVHRDIKPANIFVTNDDVVKILDFGMAKLKGTTGVTKSGTRVGTTLYMSPEQVRGEEVDEQADIWSVGVVLYEMITGQFPFEREHEHAAIYSILSEEPESITKLKSDLPEELERIRSKAMAKRPKDRFESAADLLADLTSLRDELKYAGPKTQPDAFETQRSIAVMAFADMSPQKDQEYFCEGMADEIINALTHVENLHVVARTSAFAFKDKLEDIREIGVKLNVQTLLEGSVRKSGDRLRITVNLISIEDGYHLWSERFDRELDDVFAIQDEIALAIVANLKLELLTEEREALEKRYTQNVEAYNLYLRGRHFWNKRTEHSFRKAIEYFQQAIDQDPLYALAYAGLADCYNIIAWYSNFPPKEAYPKAKAAAARALAIDNTLAEAHTSFAWSIMFQDWNWESAEKEFKRSIELKPNYSTAHHWYAFYLIFTARIDLAMVEIRRARELDPLSLIMSEDLGMIYYYTRLHDKSIDVLQNTLETAPDFVYAHFYLGWVYVQKSMYEKALAEFKEERRLSKEWNPFIEAWFGVLYAKMGRKSKAHAVLRDLMTRSRETYISPYLLAIVHFALEENDQGFQWLDEALKERHIFVCFIKVDPLFDNLRSDPRFKALLKKMGLDR